MSASNGRRESEDAPPTQNQVRVWVDGCFDMVHFGHANALRQAKLMGDTLVVALHSNADITAHKGLPVTTEEERYKMIRSIKWVDEVIEDIPCYTSVELLEKHNCDFCAHGDDFAANADGVDSYAAVKSAGKYREYKRTEGVSTTDLVARLLQMTQQDVCANEEASGTVSEIIRQGSHAKECDGEDCDSYNLITEFMGPDVGGPKPGDTVVYVAGSFDLFHAGHVDFLQKCREIGNFVIVGLHSDWEVNRCEGRSYPVMSLQQRVLSVLACKYVSDVVIGAPYTVMESMLDNLKVDYVAHGNTPVYPNKDGSDPYEVPKKRGIYRTVESGSILTTDVILKRIFQHRLEYVRRNSAKEEKEARVLEAQKKRAETASA